jgi:hypothetical protein
MYSIKLHENDRKKARGVCDGSNRGGKIIFHGATNAPTPHQIDVHLQIALSALLGMYLWHVDVTNAFTKVDCPNQIYYMRCDRDRVFRDWWADRHPSTSLPLMRFILSSRTPTAILKARASGKFIVIWYLSRSSPRTIRMLRVCTLALLMVSSFFFFEWLTTFPLGANLRKHIPSSVTCWPRTDK